MVSWRRERGFLVLVAMSASSLFRDSTKSDSIGLFLLFSFFYSKKPVVSGRICYMEDVYQEW